MSWEYYKLINETMAFVNLPQQDSWTITVSNPYDETDTKEITVSRGQTTYQAVGILEGTDTNHDGEIDFTSIDYTQDRWLYGQVSYSNSLNNYIIDEIVLVKTSEFDNGLVVQDIPLS